MVCGQAVMWPMIFLVLQCRISIVWSLVSKWSSGQGFLWVSSVELVESGHWLVCGQAVKVFPGSQVLSEKSGRWL